MAARFARVFGSQVTPRACVAGGALLGGTSVVAFSSEDHIPAVELHWSHYGALSSSTPFHAASGLMMDGFLTYWARVARSFR